MLKNSIKKSYFTRLYGIKLNYLLYTREKVFYYQKFIKRLKKSFNYKKISIKVKRLYRKTDYRKS